ncbi:hypothetical protein ACMFMG_008263 [Clarireedia jacksonii]
MSPAPPLETFRHLQLTKQNILLRVKYGIRVTVVEYTKCELNLMDFDRVGEYMCLMPSKLRDCWTIVRDDDDEEEERKEEKRGRKRKRDEYEGCVSASTAVRK